MALTIGDWILICLIGLIGIGISLYIYNTSDDYNKKNLKLTIAHQLFNLCLLVGLIFLMNWYNTSTASGIRNYKDFKSEMSNGIYRELTITAEDGREIFSYEGKFDIEINKENDNRYLRFESEDGKRYTIMYGIQDTVIITEKDSPENN